MIDEKQLAEWEEWVTSPGSAQELSSAYLLQAIAEVRRLQSYDSVGRSMLAVQCDLAREAETQASRLQTDNTMLRAENLTLRQERDEARREIVLRDHAGLHRGDESVRDFYLREEPSRYQWGKDEADRLFPDEKGDKKA